MATVVLHLRNVFAKSKCANACSFELRELESKLKAGYMNKERAAQLAEKEALKKKGEVHNKPVQYTAYAHSLHVFSNEPRHNIPLASGPGRGERE